MSRPVDQIAEHLASALEHDADPGEVLKVIAEEPGGAKMKRAAGELFGELEVLPPAYRAALGANDAQALRAVARSGRLLRRYRTRMATAAQGALGYLALVLSAVALAANLALPALLEWQRSLAPAEAGSQPLFASSAAILEVLFHPLGLVLIAAALIAAAALAARASWTRRGGLLFCRAAAAGVLCALIRVGRPLDKALLLAAETTGNRRLIAKATSAAQLARDGRPLGEVLGRADLAPEDLRAIWGLADQPASDNRDRLLEVGECLAEALEVEAEALMPTVGRRLWLTYAAVAGALVLWAALTMVLAWRELLEWPG